LRIVRDDLTHYESSATIRAYPAGTVACVSSNLSCVGLGVTASQDLGELLSAVLPQAVPLGSGGGVEVLRWQDPSGARLVVGHKNGKVADLVPSFAGTPGARLARLAPLNESVWSAEVLDETGEQVTAMAVELEQGRLLPDRAADGPFEASVVALGSDVSVHRDTARFAAEQPSMAAESFISHGLFGSAESARAHAWLAGTVLRAERRIVVQTGQAFTVARVRTAGFDTDVCLAAEDHPAVPEPASIIAGTVFLVASLDI
jgi:hypothetical protein